MKTIKEITEEFALKTSFVRSCLRSIKLLQPHIHQGERNRKLIDDDGVRIFDRIKELKEQQFSLPEIQRQLDGVKTEDSTHHQPEIKTESKQSQHEEQARLITHYETELHALRSEREQFQHERKELEQQIQDFIRKTESLSGELKALPEGKSPVELRRDYQQEQRKKQETAHILGELKSSTGLLKWKRRKKLLARLEALLIGNIS